jgi:phenylacetate-coenzyme A ligase PaaK-like adenylate-forming protein
MGSFDAWVTDPSVTRAELSAFLGRPDLAGGRFRNRLLVGTSAGTTGEAGIFVHDLHAQAVYRTLALVRGWLAWMPPGRLLRTIARGDRVAAVVATSGHYTSFSLLQLARRHRPWPFDRIRTFSIMSPRAELIQALNAFRPAELVSYPTQLRILAEEQAAGRLRLRPTLIGSGGEGLTPEARGAIEGAFRCPVRENYGAAEFPRMAWSCRRGRLHLSADWVWLEAVDEAYRPVPPGEQSATVLLTNLANRLQPLLRYDLGDQVTFHPDPCPCGGTLPTLEVEGRRDEIVRFSRPNGAVVSLGPRTLATLIEETPGIGRYQMVQTGPDQLALRVEAAAGGDGGAVRAQARARLAGYLAMEGLRHVDVITPPDPPRADPVSGKYRKVWRALGAG